MKRLYVYMIAGVCAVSAGAARADYADLRGGVEAINKVWIGGSLHDTSSEANPSLADTSAAAANTRAGRPGAWEFYSVEDSVSGGVYFEGAPLPNRYHFEFDYYDENDWYGDFRYSFKDAVRARVLSRRFYHNLDNLTLFDYDPASSTSAEVEINDVGIDDYGIRIEIDQYNIRFKTPSYPFHVYVDGETVSRKGKRQQRFLGGYGYFYPAPGRVRVSEARDVDQKSDSVAVGTNAHVGWIEFDLSHRENKFDSDVAPATYTYDSGITSVHNVIPEIKSTTDTLKLHTTHSGRLFVSSTFSKIEKTNEYSHAEAERSLGYGEIFWLPRVWLAFNLKYRHQKNTASVPSLSTNGYDKFGAPVVYNVEPGVDSTTDTASLSMRYSLIPATSLSLQYTREIKDVESESATAWSRPEKTTRDIYELKVTNRSFSRVRATARLKHKSVGFELGGNIINNEPERTDEAKLDITWTVSPRVSMFVNGMVARDESDENYISGPSTDPKLARAKRQQYVASLVYTVSDSLSLIPSYSYICEEQKRDLVWIDYAGGSHLPYVDHDYSNRQTAHNFALDILLRPVKRLRMNGTIDYTVTEGEFNPTSPIDLATLSGFDAAEIAQFSYTKLKVLNLRLDNEYDLGRGWGLGLDLHYADWKDDSFDNPSDSSYFGALFKVMKTIGAK